MERPADDRRTLTDVPPFPTSNSRCGSSRRACAQLYRSRGTDGSLVPTADGLSRSHSGATLAGRTVSITIVKIACDRDEAAFIAVEAVCREAYPRRRTSTASPALFTFSTEIETKQKKQTARIERDEDSFQSIAETQRHQKDAHLTRD